MSSAITTLAAAQVSREGTLRSALISLDRGALGIALVISPDGVLEGVLTDGDVRRALLAGATLDHGLRPFFRKEFVAVDDSTARDKVLELMQSRQIEQVPIVDATGKVTGLHTLHTILRRDTLSNWAVVMAGGRGERLRPLTDSIPKPMVRVAGRPILERIVLNLVGFGIKRVFISVNYLRDQIEGFFGDGTNHGCSVEYLREDQPLGTGGALSLLPAPPQHPLVVLNGDVLTQCDIGRMLHFHEQGGYLATVGFQDYLHTVPYGVLELDQHEVRGMREKPSHSWAANAGIYVLDPVVVGRVPERTNLPLPALLEECLDRRERVGAYRITEDWIDVGRPSELRKARGEDEPI